MGAPAGEGQSGGYNIPVSLSAASSTSTPLNQAAGVVFNFGSPGASGSVYHQEANPVNPVTATSSAALGEGATATSTSELGDIMGSGAGLKLTPAVLAIGAAILLLVAVGAYVIAKRKG